MARCDVCNRLLPEGAEGVCPECLANESDVVEVEVADDDVVIVRPIRKMIPWDPKWDTKEETRND